MNNDIRGIFRVHQFEKVEQVCITAGDLEESSRMHKQMMRCAEEFHESLGIPYRVINIVSGELNDAATIKYDLEGWFPGQGAYRELVSCSNCTDFQSRALDIRCRSPQNAHSHVHMLNSTLTATGRGICCILETFQEPDGVRVPEVLIPFMGGLKFLPFVREPRDVSRGSHVQRKSKRSEAAKALACLEIREENRADVVERIPLPEPIFIDGRVQLATLEAKLSYYPYVNGYVPSKADVELLEALDKTHLAANEFPNVLRWRTHVNSYTVLQRAVWA